MLKWILRCWHANSGEDNSDNRTSNDRIPITTTNTITAVVVIIWRQPKVSFSGFLHLVFMQLTKVITSYSLNRSISRFSFVSYFNDRHVSWILETICRADICQLIQYHYFSFTNVFVKLLNLSLVFASFLNIDLQYEFLCEIRVPDSA